MTVANVANADDVLIRPLTDEEVEHVTGGFVCGGLCILGGIVAGAGLFLTGVEIGRALHGAFHDDSAGNKSKPVPAQSK